MIHRKPFVLFILMALVGCGGGGGGGTGGGVRDIFDDPDDSDVNAQPAGESFRLKREWIDFDDNGQPDEFHEYSYDNNGFVTQVVVTPIDDGFPSSDDRLHPFTNIKIDYNYNSSGLMLSKVSSYEYPIEILTTRYDLLRKINRVYVYGSKNQLLNQYRETSYQDRKFTDSVEFMYSGNQLIVSRFYDQDSDESDSFLYYNYDSSGRLVSLTWALEEFTLNYNSQEFLVGVSGVDLSDNSPTLDASYAYNLKGEVIYFSAEGPFGGYEIRVDYDSESLPIRQVVDWGGSKVTKNFEYETGFCKNLYSYPDFLGEFSFGAFGTITPQNKPNEWVSPGMGFHVGPNYAPMCVTK